MSLDPPCRIPAQRLDPQPLGPGKLHHALHELTGGSGAAQRGWGFDIGDDQRRALTRIAGEHGLAADIQLEPAPLRVISDVPCHTATSAKPLSGFGPPRRIALPRLSFRTTTPNKSIPAKLRRGNACAQPRVGTRFGRDENNRVAPRLHVHRNTGTRGWLDHRAATGMSIHVAP